MEFKNISVRKVKDIFVAEATDEVKIVNVTVITKEDLQRKISELDTQKAEYQKLFDAIVAAEIADSQVIPE
jgi:hypothetical protein